MRTEQASKQITNTPQIYNTIDLFHTDITNTQYLCFNLFRILRNARKKFNLTINEIIILCGMIIYSKLVASSFSYSAIVKHVRYFNDNKMRYYIKSLLSKGYIVQSDINVNGTLIRYKITEKSLDVLNCINESYNKELNSFCLLYGISL